MKLSILQSTIDSYGDAMTGPKAHAATTQLIMTSTHDTGTVSERAQDAIFLQRVRART